MTWVVWLGALRGARCLRDIKRDCWNKYNNCRVPGGRPVGVLRGNIYIEPVKNGCLYLYLAGVGDVGYNNEYDSKPILTMII